MSNKIYNNNSPIKNSTFGTVVMRIVGLLLIISSLIMLPPIMIGMIYQDGDIKPFFHGFLVLFVLGACLLYIFRKATSDLKIRSAFIVVGMSWVIIGLSCAIPLYNSEVLNLSLADAIFESVSALTTTGSTILNNLDSLPHSILFYRQLLQWLGGMGIIVLAIAILPVLRIGGIQMFKAETPGPMKDNKLTPRITETAKTLWLLYLTMTVACATAYYMAGMSLFDAVSHAFSTISTGGMSTHDASIGYFNNSLIEIICIVFMILAGFNFAAHFIAWRSASMKVYLHDTEIKVYLGIIIAAFFITSIVLVVNDTYPTMYEAIRHSAFQVVAMVSNTGFSTANISTLPWMLPLFLILLGSVGACAGSTSGGIKLVRVILLYKLSMREFYRLIHPHGKFIIKMNDKNVHYRVLDSVSAFILQFMTLLIFFILVSMSFGEDITTATSTVLSALANLGPALGEAHSNYSSLQDSSKWVLSLVMIFGRLEIFTLFILFIPAYWES
ncbi:MAG: TrkH family potassium uptake protein [Proteobacteria bacterium]|nr:TrkH family potassium uptake protein [Pseudomonadota bacterium]